MTRADTQVNVRLSAEILARLKAAAAASGRSMTAELNAILDAATPAVQVVKTQIRLPAELHNQLMAATKESGRSFNAEMVSRLFASFPQSHRRESTAKSPKITPDPEMELLFTALERKDRERKRDAKRI